MPNCFLDTRLSVWWSLPSDQQVSHCSEVQVWSQIQFYLSMLTITKTEWCISLTWEILREQINCSFLCPENVLNAQAILGLLTEHNTDCSGASLSKLSSSATWFLLTWSGDEACLNWALELLCRTFECATCRGTTTDRLPLPPSSTCPLQNSPDLQDWRVFLPPEPLWTCLMLLESQHWVLLIIYYFIPCA